ncbi:MAG: cyclic nucleotide-binding domain-containing protein [Elusimicrobiota bacterium]
MAFESEQEKEWLCDALRGTDFFAACSLGEIEKLIVSMDKKSYKEGTKIVKQGEMGEFFFMIAKGKVSVWVERKGYEKQRVNILGPGKYFGEIALMREMPRTATIIADEPCEAFLLYRSDFRELVLENPALERRIEQIVEKRLAEQEELTKSAEKSKGIFGKLFGK